MVQAEDEAGAELILQSERDRSIEYVTQWFTNDPDTFCGDTPVADEETGFLYCNGITRRLARRTVRSARSTSPTSPVRPWRSSSQGSASGYLIPALQLLDSGVDPVDDIDATFAGGHDPSVLAVYNGDATVGVSFNDARTLLVDQFPDVGEKVVVFAWSAPIPNDGFAVAGELPDDLKEAIAAALIDIAESPDGVEPCSRSSTTSTGSYRSTRRPSTSSVISSPSWPTADRVDSGVTAQHTTRQRSGRVVEHPGPTASGAA